MAKNVALLRVFLVGLSLLLLACSKDDAPPADLSETNDAPGGAGPGTDPDPGEREPGRTIIVSENPIVCETDDDCDDGDACNGEEACEDGVCVFGQALDCNDGIGCTIDSCDPNSGSCSNTPRDEDGDGHGDAECTDDDGASLGDDCDDSDSNRYPGNREVCVITFGESSNIGVGDGVDEDCDPSTFGQRDADGDGYIDELCYNTADDGSRNGGRDCNDFVASVSPAASEVCDYFDNNCNGEIDEGLTVDRYDDPDGDGYGGVYDPDNPNTVTLVERAVCPGEVRVAVDEIDCAPEDRLISPDRDELCDGVDNNCNGEIDENVVPSTWYRDFDGDGYGNPEGGTKSTCERIDHLGWSLFLGDCDDTNPLVNPSQPELCDGLDNDCNPETSYLIGPGNSEDDDGDGIADPSCGTTRPDCDDSDATVYPGAPELCDGIDNDCNGIVDTRTDVATWYVDADGDGFGVAAGAISSCEPVTGRVTVAGDCDDSEPAVNPGAADDCTGIHGVNDDCDDNVDEGETPVYSYRDLDGDGYGLEEVISYCQPITGVQYASQGNDCDESEALTNPGVPEDCSPDSTVDRDCDGNAGCSDTQCLAEPACQALFGLQLLSPEAEPIAAFTSSTFEVTVSLTDPDMNPIFPADIFVAGDPGTKVPDGAIGVDASGEATFTIGVGMAEGAYTFTVTSGTTTPLVFTVDAQLPAQGTVWSVLNRNGTNATVEASFGPDASLYYYLYDIDATSDGKVYVAGYYDVGVLDPVGQFSVVAGNGSGQDSGDGSPALNAGLYYPRFIAVDEQAQILYVANTVRVRQVRLDQDPPTIHAVAGGGDGEVPGPAELADIGTIHGLDVLPNGHVIISTTLGVLEYDPSPLSKQLDYFGIDSGGAPDYVGFYSTYAPEIRQQGDRTLFWSNYLTGGGYGSQNMAGVAGFFGGETYRMVGVYASAPNTLMTEGSPMDSSHWSGAHPSTAFRDTAGNLIFGPEASTFGSSLWKIDAVRHRATRFAGTTTDGAGEDYVARLNAQFQGPISMDVGPDGDLWVAEEASYGRVRRIRGGSIGTRSNLNLNLVSADGTSYWPGQSITGTVSQVTDDEANSLSEVTVRQVPASGWEPMYSSDQTDFDGVSFNTGYAEILVGTHSLQTQAWDLDQTIVDADVLSYEVVTPPSGSVSTWVNVTHESAVTATEGQPALTTGFSTIQGMTTRSDGTIYLTTNSHGYAVFRVDTNGYVSRVAGGNGGGSSGNYLPALEAELTTMNDVAIDEDNELLYLLLGGGSSKHIRVVDLTSGIIYPFAGYGEETALGVAAMDRAPWYIYSIQIHEGVLYLAGAEGIDIIDTEDLTPTVETWMIDADGTTGCNDDPLRLFYCNLDDCQLAFRDDGKAYLAAYMCGSSLPRNDYGVALVAADGTLESLVGGFGPTVSAASYDALDSDNVQTKGLALDSSGNLYFTEQGRHWLRRIGTDGNISTVAGSAAFDYGDADFVAGAEAEFYNPTRLAILPDDSVLVLDINNYALRRYWP